MPMYRRYPFARRGRALTGREKTRLALLALLASFLLFLVPAVRYFRALTGAMAVSNASDLITRTVSDIVEDKMLRLQEEGRQFVLYDKDETGGVTAIVTDTAQVNILSSEILHAVIEASDQGNLDLAIPLGDLLGASVFLGRGPRVPVKITMLTSSRADFRNDLVSAGINQTKHRVVLELRVDVDVLLPWEILSTQIVSDILVAETLVVGSVPETYMNWDR